VTIRPRPDHPPKSLTWTRHVPYHRQMASFTPLSIGDTMRTRVLVVGLSAYIKGLGGDVA
jgi:hypothetical protein